MNRRRLTQIAAAIGVVICLMVGPASAPAAVINGLCYPHPIRLGVGDGGPANAPKVAQANILWVRMTIRWRDVQPNAGTWSWGGVDNLVNAHYSRGRKILAILSTAPQWAGSNANGTRPVGTVADTSLWEEFVRRVAIRYAGKIDAYEIWNEPDFEDHDVGVGWDGPLYYCCGRPRPYYALYVKRASQQIRAHAPGTLVVAPATRSYPVARTSQVYASLQEYGTAAHIDVVSFHANAQTSDSSSTVWSQIRNTLGRIRSNNPASFSKPMWITEFGWTTAHNGEGGQRDKIRATARNLTWRGVTGPCSPNDIPRTFLAFIFTLKDAPNFTRGIYRENGTPKAIVPQYLQTLRTWGIQPPTPEGSFSPFTVNCSGRTCTFTSGYSGASGRRFDWSFGDGATARGRSVTHTYAARGQYHVYHGAARSAERLSDARLIDVR